jgi:hypothetical protein
VASTGRPGERAMQVEAWSVVWTCRVRVFCEALDLQGGGLVSPCSPRFIRGRFSALHADCMRADSICASLEHYYWLSLIAAIHRKSSFVPSTRSFAVSAGRCTSISRCAAVSCYFVQTHDRRLPRFFQNSRLGQAHRNVKTAGIWRLGQYCSQLETRFRRYNFAWHAVTMIPGRVVSSG